MRAARAAIAFEPAGEQLLKGKAAPVPAWRALRVVARRGGAGRREQLEAPFVGRDAGAAPAQGPSTPPARERRPRLVVDHRPGRHRQEPAGVGVPEIHRRRDRGRVLAPGPLARLRRGDQLLGAGRDGPRPRRAHRDATTRPRHAREVAATLDRMGHRRDERRWIEPRLLQLLGLEPTARSARPRRRSSPPGASSSSASPSRAS